MTSIQSHSIRRFYRLSQPAEDDLAGALECQEGTFDGFDASALRCGRKMGSLPANLRVFIRGPARLRDEANVVVNSYGLIIVSQELAVAFTDVAGDDIELLRVPICEHTGTPLRRPFFTLNALRLIDVLSEQKTVRSSRALGSRKPVRKLAIVAQKVPEDVHVFRVTGWLYPLLLDSAVYQRLSIVRHDGLGLVEIEQE